MVCPHRCFRPQGSSHTSATPCNSSLLPSCLLAPPEQKECSCCFTRPAHCDLPFVWMRANVYPKCCKCCRRLGMMWWTASAARRWVFTPKFSAAQGRLRPLTGRSAATLGSETGLSPSPLPHLTGLPWILVLLRGASSLGSPDLCQIFIHRETH